MLSLDVTWDNQNLPPLSKYKGFEVFWYGVILWDGADDRNRTGDLRVTSALLYQLSYIGGHELTRQDYSKLHAYKLVASEAIVSIDLTFYLFFEEEIAEIL